jgi:parallel beta-helix repeat protein
MANELGSDYTSGGDYTQADFWNGEVPTSNIAKVDSPSANKSRVRAAHVNDLGAEVVAIARRLGAAARGSQDSVEDRLGQGLDSYGNPGGIRHTLGFDTLLATVNNDTAAAVAGQVQGQPGVTESMDIVSAATEIYPESGTRINLPPNYKIDRTKTSGATGTGRMIFRLDNKTDFILDGGELDGNAAVNGYYGEYDMGVALYGCSRIKIMNVYFHNHSGDAVYVNDCTDVIFENCFFDNPNVQVSGPLVGRNGVAIVADDGNTCQNIKFVNCTFRLGYPAALDIEPNAGGTVRNVQIVNCYFYGSSKSGNGVMIAAGAGTSCYDVSVIGCHFYDLENGFYYYSGLGTVQNIVVKGCVFRGNTRGIRLRAAYNVLIDGNSFDTNGYGIAADAVAGPNYITITNNVIMNSNSWGISLYGSGAATLSHCSVMNNTVINSALTQSPGVPAIFLYYADYLKVTGNKVFDTTGSPVQTYGISLVSCDYAFVDGNWLYNNATSDTIYESGCTNVVYGTNCAGTTVDSDLTGDILTVDSGATAFMAYLQNDNGCVKFGHAASLNKMFSRNAADGDNQNLVIAANGADTHLVLTTAGRVGIGKTPSATSKLDIDLATADLEIQDAGAAGGTEAAWVQVLIGGSTAGYLRVYAAK